MAKISEYTVLFSQHVDKIRTLKEQQEAIKEQIRRNVQMAKAALAMMPDDERAIMTKYLMAADPQTEGLTQEIRNVLFNAYQLGWMTAVSVKAALDKSGYDFSGYSSNPLVSIHATLKRFKKQEVVCKRMADNSMGYRLTRKTFEERRSIETAQREVRRINEQLKNIAEKNMGQTKEGNR